jgi:hypothetical protein
MLQNVTFIECRGADKTFISECRNGVKILQSIFNMAEEANLFLKPKNISKKYHRILERD